MTAEHSDTVSIKFVEIFPAHEPREDDPNYKYFHQAKKRLKEAGLLVCNVKSDEHYGQIELHHAYVEYAHQNDVDLDKFNDIWGLHLSDEDFAKFVEGVPYQDIHGKWHHSLEPLCTQHHRGTRGIHSLPTPVWNVIRVAKDERDIVMVQANSEIPLQKPKT